MTERSRKEKCLRREFEIRNQLGIHARPAAMFVKTAQRYDAEVSVEKDGHRVSGKSIMGLLTLEAAKGARIAVLAEGPDAEALLDELTELIEGKFTEE